MNAPLKNPLKAVATWNKKAPAQAGVETEAERFRREIDELAEIKAKLAPLNKAEKRLVDAMRARYDVDGLYPGTNFALSRSTTHPEVFDKDAFEADQPELYAKYLKPTNRITFSIKPKA